MQSIQIDPEHDLATVSDLSTRGKVLAILLLCLACVHCSRAIFFENVSWINLKQYSIGLERSPFQQRVAMMPILRLGGSSTLMARAAAMVDHAERHQLGRESVLCAEVMSPEKLTSVIVGTGCNLIATLTLFIYGRRFGGLRWLPPVIFLGILYVSYAARYEQAYWYPYDLPHAMLFGLACLMLLEGPIWLFFPLFLLDIPMRETSIFLILISLPVFLQRWGWKRALGVSASLAAAYLAIRIPIAHHFAHNISETGERFTLNLKNLALPLHWPQMASALGFLLLPIWMGRAYLPHRPRIFLWTMLPCLCVTVAYGIWVESRIAIEWSIPCALLATIELYHLTREMAFRDSTKDATAA